MVVSCHGLVLYIVSAMRAVIELMGESRMRNGKAFGFLVPVSNYDFKIYDRISPVTGKNWLRPNQADYTAITFFH